MIPCPCDGCLGEMHEHGFTKKAVDQNCPDCGRFRKYINGDKPQYYCPNCLTTQDIEIVISLYVCDKCSTLRTENNLNINKHTQ